MLIKMKSLIPMAIALGMATTINAEVISLTSLDGKTMLSGEFVSFDGQKYTIKTIVGELSVDAFQVQCSGAACPVMTNELSQYGISGSSKVVGSLFADLMFEFGLDIGAETLTSMGNSGPTMINMQDESGNELAEITLVASNSSDGFRDLLNGTSDLAVTTRQISEKENNIFRSAGMGDLLSEEQETIFALDGLVIITAPNNPLRAVAEQDIARIFSGKVTNWSQIGGPNAPIHVYARSEDSGTGVVFDELIMRNGNAKLGSDVTIVDSDTGVASAVIADPLGIGVTSLSDAVGANILDIRGVCGIQVPATAFTIKTEEYPLTRRLYAYTAQNDVPGQLTRFLSFLDTDLALNAISNSGYIDLGVAYQENNEQGLRYLAAVMPTDVEVDLNQLRSMTAELLASDRMSITFRFALGSARLDARAVDDIKRLASIISTGDFNNKEILLIGFTDSVGSGASNTELSKERANQVYAALMDAAPAGGFGDFPIRTLGYGEISPLSCNESAHGRNINRRVEVWLRDVVTVSQ